MWTSTEYRKCVLTVDGEVDPGAVHVGLVAAVEEDDGALVPALVGRADVGDADGRLLDKRDAPLEAGVDVRRVAVELDEDGHLHTCGYT